MECDAVEEFPKFVEKSLRWSGRCGAGRQIRILKVVDFPRVIKVAGQALELYLGGSMVIGYIEAILSPFSDGILNTSGY